MLTLLALSVALLQDPPAPPPPPPGPETHFMMMGGPGGPGHLDKDGDGQVSREEFSAPMNDAFARMDKDGDGRLSTEELAEGHRGMMGGDHNVMFMRHGDGAEGGPGERREERVVVIGGDGHGEHGMPMVMMDGPGHDGPGGERITIHRMGDDHGDMDKNGDGKISEEEFVGPMREAFARMDADHSGFIETGEHGDGDRVHVFTRHIEHTDGDHDGDHH